MTSTRVIVVIAAVSVTAGAFLAEQRLRATGPLQNAKSAKTESIMVPQFQYDKTWPKEPLPAQWKLGQVVGVHVDTRDNVWIIQRPGTLKNSEKEATDLATYGAPAGRGGAGPGGAAGGAGGRTGAAGATGNISAASGPLAACCKPAPPVIAFDQEGTVILSWGGPGQGFEWPTPAPRSPDSGLGSGPFGEHAVFSDFNDNVWIGADGPGDGQILKFTRFGKFELQIGHTGGVSKGSNDLENLNGAQQIAVHPTTNEVFVADGLKNHRVVVFEGTTGKYLRHWGAYGNKPDDEAASVKYDPNVRSKQFGEVHGIALSRDGLVYVCDRTNDRVQVFRSDGTFVKEGLVAPATLGGSAYEIAFSSDPDQRYAYVVDGMNEKVWILMRDSLETIGSFGYGGHYGGAFDAAHSIATDSKGNIYVGETWESKRVQRFLYKGLAPASR
jgi:NHL repeat